MISNIIIILLMISPLSRESNESSYKMCMIENHQPRTCCLIPFSNEFSLETNYISLTRIASFYWILSFPLPSCLSFSAVSFLVRFGKWTVSIAFWNVQKGLKRWNCKAKKHSLFQPFSPHVHEGNLLLYILCFILELTLFTWWAYQAHDQLVRIHVIT